MLESKTACFYSVPSSFHCSHVPPPSYMANSATEQTEERKTAELPVQTEAPVQVSDQTPCWPSYAGSGEFTEIDLERNVEPEVEKESEMLPSCSRDVHFEVDMPSSSKGVHFEPDMPECSSKAIRFEAQAPVDPGKYPPVTIVRPPRSAFQNAAPSRPPMLKDLPKWDTMKLVEAGTFRVATNRNTRAYVPPNKSEIVVDEPEKVNSPD